MQGYVLSVRPHSGEATIIAESGEAFRVCDYTTAVRLHGGDIVRFNPAPTSEDHRAMDLEFVAPCPDQFTQRDSDLLREFCAAISSSPRL